MSQALDSAAHLRFCRRLRQAMDGRAHSYRSDPENFDGAFRSGMAAPAHPDPVRWAARFARLVGICRTCWIQYGYAARKEYIVSRYAITSAGDDPEKDPQNWTLLGSEDGSQWTSLDIQKSQAFLSRGQRRIFTFANVHAFQFYRLQIQAAAGSAAAGGVQISKLEFLEPIPARTKNGFPAAR
ncbi:MAG: hypothetical protein ACRYFS_11550 [Janthinobacterium lividum]